MIQSDPYNASRLATTLAVVITSHTGLAAMPGDVFLPATSSGLPKDSVVNVTALVTVDKSDLGTAAGQLPPALMNDVDRGSVASWDSSQQAHCRCGCLVGRWPASQDAGSCLTGLLARRVQPRVCCARPQTGG